MGPLKCPHCGAIGTRIEDPLVVKDLPVNFPYCGKCGKNWPKP